MVFYQDMPWYRKSLCRKVLKRKCTLLYKLNTYIYTIYKIKEDIQIKSTVSCRLDNTLGYKMK